MSDVTDTDLVLDVLGEPNRRQLLELVAASGLRQPQVSKHLKVLATAELVSARVDGRYRRYRLDGRGLHAAHDWFASFDDVLHARFDTLDELVTDDPDPHPDPHQSEELTG